MKRMLPFIAACGFAVSLVAQVTVADPPKPAKSKLDEELLKGLGEDPLAEMPEKPAQGEAKSPDAKPGSEEPKSDVKKPPEPKAKSQPQDELDKQLLEGLGEGEDIGAENPLVRIGKQMRQAGTRIGKNQADEKTQELQKRVMADIERLLKLARQQQQQQQSSQSQKQQTAQRQQVKQAQPKPGQGDSQQSDKPAKESTDRLGKPELRKMDPALRAEVIKRAWGNLPEKEREQMLQNGTENFLPKYELLIEEYFKALAERQEKNR